MVPKLHAITDPHFAIPFPPLPEPNPVLLDVRVPPYSATNVAPAFADAPSPLLLLLLRC